MESFSTKVSGLKPLTIVAKVRMVDVCENSGYTSGQFDQLTTYYCFEITPEQSVKYVKS